MNFSEKQLELIKYFLRKLNFLESELNEKEGFIPKYLDELSKTYIQFQNVGNCMEVKKLLPYFKYVYDGKTYKVDEFSLINYLQLELNIKKEKEFIKINNNLTTISATDISNYTYCPVSYSISRTFRHILLEKTEIGIEKHTNSLINKLVKNTILQDDNIEKSVEFSEYELSYDENYQELKNKLKDFEVLFSGHKENEKKYFKSLKGNYVGQPDYILKNIFTNEIVVIEEKYQYIPSEIQDYSWNYYNAEKIASARDTYEKIMESINEKRNKNIFHKNHINQTMSYLYGISEYEIKYAFLVYWKYEIKNKKRIVTKCYFKTIDKKQEKQDRKDLNSIFKNIIKINSEGLVDFDINNRKANKCASCVNNYLCGHKTGRYSKLTIPYDISYSQVKNYVPYPEILKKNEDEKSNTIKEPLITFTDEYRNSDDYLDFISDII